MMRTAVHRLRGKHVLAAEDGFSDQCASDAVCDRVIVRVYPMRPGRDILTDE